MGDIGDLFKELREHKRAKRASNTKQSTQALINAGVQFTSLNGGVHLLVMAADGSRIDFWPSTGLWKLRSSNVKHRGVFRLIQRALARAGEAK
jgi:hypothetical protein